MIAVAFKFPGNYGLAKRLVAEIDQLKNSGNAKLILPFDFENTDADAFQNSPFFAGIVVHEVDGCGGHEEGLSDDELRTKIEAAHADLRPVRELLEAAELQFEDATTYAIASGWLAGLYLIKGEWMPNEPPEEPQMEDFESEEAYEEAYVYYDEYEDRMGDMLEAPADEHGIEYCRGSDDGSQEYYPGGGVRGVRIAAVREPKSSKYVELKLLEDAEVLNEQLRAGGIPEARYHLLSVYD